MGKRFQHGHHEAALRHDMNRKYFDSSSMPSTENSSDALQQESHLHQIAELAMQNEVLEDSIGATDELGTHYANLFEIAPIGLFILTEDGLIAEINGHGAMLLGDERSALPGKPFVSFATPEHEDGWQELFDCVMQEGLRQVCELVLKRTDGSLLNARLEGVRLERGATSMLYLTLVDSDGWDRQDMRIPRPLADPDPAVFYVFVLPVDGPLYIEYMSAGAKTLLEVPVAESMQSASVYYEHIHSADRIRYLEAITRSRKYLEPLSLEYRIIVPSGQIKWVHAIAHPVTRKNGDVAWFGIFLDVSGQKRAMGQLAQSRIELHDMAVQIQLVREEERTRIARDLHDELGQELTALKLDIGWLKNRLEPTQIVLHKMADELMNRVDGAVGSVRRIARELRPRILETQNLTASIEWLVADFREIAGIHCKLTLPTEPLNVSEQQTTHLFHICQELLTNVARHANAVSAEVALSQDHTCISLEVADDGQGMPQQSGNTTLGLLGVRERAEHLGGTMEIVNGAGTGGTRVIVRIPLESGNTG